MKWFHSVQEVVCADKHCGESHTILADMAAILAQCTHFTYVYVYAYVLSTVM